MSQFSPELFLDMELNEPTEKLPPLPIGDYTGVIGDVKGRAWQKDERSGIAWDVLLTIDVPAEIQQELELPSTLMLTDSLFIDLTPAGTIDNGKGKNRRLRTYRDALDLNKPGDAFSARRMTGGTVRVKIKHDLWNDQIFAKVDGVSKL